MSDLGLFTYLVLFPAIALFGAIYALAGYSRLSVRREWLNLPAREWRRVRIQLSLLVVCYPVFWLLSQQLWSLQNVAIPVFTIGMAIAGAMLGRKWLAMAQNPRP